MKKRTGLSFCTAMLLVFSQTSKTHAQTDEERAQIASSYDQKTLESMFKQFKDKEEGDRINVLEYLKKQARESNKTGNLSEFETKQTFGSLIRLPDGGVKSLFQITPDGKPLYCRTMSVDAAKSTRANQLHSGGSLGLNLMGQNMRAYIWDGGAARKTHQEYDGPGGNNRFTNPDNADTVFHSGCVAGVIMSSGVNPKAKGMAPHCSLVGYDYLDHLSEATKEAAKGMLVSNHSYGLGNVDEKGNFMLESNYAGAYITECRDWDQLMYEAPYYLMLVVAGNDGRYPITAKPLMNGYDKLTWLSVCKNNLVVASAKDAVVDNNGNLLNPVQISEFSSQGPTDDLRIKPDITGNGQDVFSSSVTTNTSYETHSGTSFATPNVTGTLLLLQQHYKNLNSSYMRAATLKGLALHTADDAGPTGPDAVFGWGLLNAKRAAKTISDRNVKSIIRELSIAQGETISFNVKSDGSSPLMASISWTDKEGTPSFALNNNAARLVNDLDIRVVKADNTSFPWRLVSANTNGKGDNVKDPYERVDINNASGTYTIVITHKGNLTNQRVNFSLIVTGIDDEIPCTASIPTNVDVIEGSRTAKVTWRNVNNASYVVRYRESNTSSWTSINTTENYVVINNLDVSKAYELQIKSVCLNNNSSAFTSIVKFSTIPEVVSAYCTSRAASSYPNYIKRVELNSIDKSSGSSSGSGYSDHTNSRTTLVKGSTYTIKITPHWYEGIAYDDYYAVWIDFNQNGIFENSEKVLSRKDSLPVFKSTIKVPKSALTGSTRMRVSMNAYETPNPCGIFENGEVEDYTVDIEGAFVTYEDFDVSMSGTSHTNKVTIYPNPVENTIFFSSIQDINFVEIYNYLGEKVYDAKPSSQIDVSNFANGLYIVKLRLNDNSEQSLKIVK